MARILIFSCCLLSFNLFSQQTGVDVLKMMHDFYADGKWAQTRTYHKKIKYFKNDLEVDSTVRFEAAQFPDKLRIDFDSLTSGNSTIWNRDSVFIFQKNKLLKKYSEQNELLFLLGGWHFYSLDSAVAKLTELKFDATQPVRTAGFKSKTCWVVGDIKLGGNEVWIEQKKLVPMRILTQTHGTNDETWVENYVKFPRGWCEGKVTFYQDGHIIRTETLDQIRADKPLDKATFEPARYRTRQ